MKNNKRIEKPGWILLPIRAHSQWTNELELFYHALLRGIHMVSGLPKMNEAFLQQPDHLQDEISPEGKHQDQELLERDALLGEFDKNEIEVGFPRIHAHLLVSYWGALETYIDETLLNWMENNSACLEAPEIERIKIRLIQFNKLTARDRLSYILNML